MKSILTTCITFLSIALSYSQNFQELGQYEFSKVESYQTEQPKVLECANYLFNTPSDKEELNRLTATQYIMKWMEGTPAYTFQIGPEALELTKGNSDLFALYLAGLTKTVLEYNGTDELSSTAIHNASEQLLVEYCSNPANNIKPSKKIKKLIKQKKKK